MAVIVLDKLETWPSDVIACLTQHRHTFVNWEAMRHDRPYERVAPRDYDSAVYALAGVLSDHLLHGYHCTRLTDAEVAAIKAEGMRPSSAVWLAARIEALVSAKIVSPDVAVRLKANNLAEEQFRQRMIWFCFFPPHRAGESGISRFFRSWGGEALYGAHERDSEMGPLLRRIGTPCIVEADVPIASTSANGLAIKVGARFAISRGGLAGIAAPDHEDYAREPIPHSSIRTIHRVPEPSFGELTACDGWRDVLVA